MSLPKPPEGRLADMLFYCRQAQEFVSGFSYESYLQDAKTQSACLNAVRTVGEAASQIPIEFQAAYPMIPWRQIIDTRHRLTHGYDHLRWDVLWAVIQTDLPALEPLLVTLLDELAERGG